MKKTAIHSLVCLLRSLLLTTCSDIVQTSLTSILSFFPTAILQGCGAETIIFVLSVLSAAVICPALGNYQEHAITILTALGAACLAGDAIFHLIPHVSTLGRSSPKGTDNELQKFAVFFYSIVQKATSCVLRATCKKL